MLVEVSQVTMPPKRTFESFFMASTKPACQHNENETAVDEGEVGGVGVVDENGMFYFEPLPPTFYFVLPQLMYKIMPAMSYSLSMRRQW